MRYVYILIGLIFALFAYWQMNDPDAVAWVVIYGMVGVLNLAAARGVFLKWSTIMLGVACLIWMLSLLPGFVDWLNNGMPSIASEMKTDQPHIEVVREFLGLFLCILALTHLFIRSKRKHEA
jgi:uncharacterized membrane protein